MIGSRRGFTLIEIMITMGMLGVITATSLAVVKGLGSAAVHVEDKTGQLLLQNDLRKVLSTRASCMGAIQTPSFDAGLPRNPLKLKLPQGTIAAAGAALDAYGTLVKALDLTKPREQGDLPNGDKMYVTQLVLLSEGLSAPVFQYAPAPISTLFISVNPTTHQITDCLTNNSDQTFEDLTCAKINGKIVNGVCRVPPQSPGITCEDGTYLEGFDSAGTKRCRPFAPPTPDCPDTAWQGTAAVSSGRQNGAVNLTVDYQTAIDQIKPTCQMNGVTINARTFGAYAGSCFSAVSFEMPNSGTPAYAGFANGGGSGNKTNFSTAVWNGNRAYLTNNAGGWGNCGGNQCAACISDVQVVVHSKPKN